VYFQKPTNRGNISIPAGKYTSSFQAEMTALHACLTDIRGKKDESALIITDSLSAWQRIRALINGKNSSSKMESEIRTELERCQDNNTKIHIMWSPSHCEIRGNDMADDLANEGRTKDQAQATWTHDTAKSRIKSHAKIKILHREEHTIYRKEDGTTRIPKSSGNNRGNQVLASRVRSNHHPDTLYWRRKMGLAEEDTCRLCKMAQESAHHIIRECPVTTNFINNQNETLFNESKIRQIWDRWTAKISQLQTP